MSYVTTTKPVWRRFLRSPLLVRPLIGMGLVVMAVGVYGMIQDGGIDGWPFAATVKVPLGVETEGPAGIIVLLSRVRTEDGLDERGRVGIDMCTHPAPSGSPHAYCGPGKPWSMFHARANEDAPWQIQLSDGVNVSIHVRDVSVTSHPPAMTVKMRRNRIPPPNDWIRLLLPVVAGIVVAAIGGRLRSRVDSPQQKPDESASAAQPR